MLVDINLLPKRDTKNSMLIGILLVAVLLLLVAGIFLFWQGKSLESQIATLTNQIQTTEKLVAIEQEKANGGFAGDSVAALETAVVWASEEPLKTVPIIQHVASLLPYRGFIQNISYAETGNVNLTVQFDTSRESAYYLKTLLDSEWFSAVNLSAVSTQDLTAETEPESEPDRMQEIVPRYIGQFQLQLDRQFIQNKEQTFADSEGGVES